MNGFLPMAFRASRFRFIWPTRGWHGLERKQMLEVEGGTEDWCLQILRHEAGHAIDTAYRLHRRKHYRKLFGKYTAPYPEHYYPKPYSKNYVLHLEPSYAQAHPAEDFRRDICRVA